MNIFRATDIRINSIPIIGYDVQHANHLLLGAFYDGLRHWPGFSYAIGPYRLALRNGANEQALFKLIPVNTQCPRGLVHASS